MKAPLLDRMAECLRKFLLTRESWKDFASHARELLEEYDLQKEESK